MEIISKIYLSLSHAAAYALLSYRTAYLKCRFPKEYMAAILTSQLGSDKYAYYFAECQQMGIPILPPDINESQLSFSVSGNGLRFGLVGVKNVGEGLIEAIFRERNRTPFTSFGNFVERMRQNGLNKKAAESLILSGAFDSFGIARSRLYAVVDTILDRTRDAQRVVMPGQMSLFDSIPSQQSESNEEIYPDIPEFSEQELLRGEKNVCGVYLSGHPLKNHAHLAKVLRAEEIYSFRSEPERFHDGDQVVLLCLVGSVTLKQVRSGGKMAFVQGEDDTGRCEIIVFPKVLTAASALLEEGKIVAVYGTVNTKDEEVKILANKILTPEEASQVGGVAPKPKSTPSSPPLKNEEITDFKSVSKIFLRFSEKGSKIEKRVMALLRIFPGKTPCFFYYRDSEKLFRMDGVGAELTPTVYRELISLLGKENVVLK